MKFTLRRLDARDVDWELIVAVIGIMLLLIVLVMRLVPQQWQPDHPCVFHRLTGYPCITCGGTRAARALGRLEPAKALRSNPLVASWLLLVVPHAMWVALSRLLNLPRPRIVPESRRDRRILGGLLVAGLLANWAYLVAADI
jgi:hypothetical protein